MERNLDSISFDHLGRYVIQNYAAARPFASFLPGIAGPMGIPVWAFYVNRGQAMAAFGVENKDNPIMEFQPANKAYRDTPYTGFRTFLKLSRNGETALYEPFSPWESSDPSAMYIGMNELELETTSASRDLQTNVLYFTLAGEPLAGLVRQVTVTNVSRESVALEILDGMPLVMPFGVDNRGLKEIGRTAEAWMAVFNLEQGVPFYRYQASAGDSAEVSEIQAGHFYLCFDDAGQLLPAFVDPVAVFGQNTSLSTADRFTQQTLAEMGRQRQITTGRTPCGFFGVGATLEPGESATLHAIIGHVGDISHLHREQVRLASPAYLQQKRQQANQLARQLTDVVHTQTASPRFDAYTRQTFLDNVLRGGWPLMVGGGERPFVYHVYSRKHGDLERDYNYFYVAAEPYSQGNANYRDVNQNRRCDVLLNPQVKDYNVLAFMGLLQADGYNPLVVEGSRFSLPAEHRTSILHLVDHPDKLEPMLSQLFTPGGLLRAIADWQIGLKVPAEAFLTEVLAQAKQTFEASFHEGYWVDHWLYNLDLIDSYLAVYPDKKEELLFDRPVPYYDSPAMVQPRARKTVLTADGRVRQYGAVLENEEKAALIASRAQAPNLARTLHGQGEVYLTTVFAKLAALALVKFATLDPLGMGIEMEAGKPGWYDALNGLPGLFGSSLCETYELERLLAFLLETLAEKGMGTIELSVEQYALLQAVWSALETRLESDDPDRDFQYWDAVATARETYRRRVRFGFDGQTTAVSCGELTRLLTAFEAKVRVGIGRAVDMNDGIPPTYIAYTVTDYEALTGDNGEGLSDERGRPYVRAKAFEPTVLPLFLEGPVHALKVQPDVDSARRLYDRVRGSALFDRELEMYKVNAPLEDQSHEIGRARAFTSGWLENESIWLHMEYKYLLEMLRAELYEEFIADIKSTLVPFLNPEAYGRSPLENSSFIVSSAHPDDSLHGAGFVARLSGATAEFLSIWSHMMAGPKPFFLQDGQLCLRFRPALPGWLFDKVGDLRFRFLGNMDVVYHNPDRIDVTPDDVAVARMVLHFRDGATVDLVSAVVKAPYAEQVRVGQVRRIDVFLELSGR